MRIGWHGRAFDLSANFTINMEKQCIVLVLAPADIDVVLGDPNPRITAQNRRLPRYDLLFNVSVCKNAIGRHGRDFTVSAP